MPDAIFEVDKIAHFFAYAALASGIALWPPAGIWRLYPLRISLIIIVITSAYGMFDELHQSFVPGRDASVYDWIADTLGAGFGAGTYAWWQSRRN
jgi:VanZ family protein